jgi:hypothetical protein
MRRTGALFMGVRSTVQMVAGKVDPGTNMSGNTCRLRRFCSTFLASLAIVRDSVQN